MSRAEPSGTSPSPSPSPSPSSPSPSVPLSAPPLVPPPAESSQIRASRAAALLAWYDAEARDLPWRAAEGCADPYAVLVSELMLQQTRVDTVRPYFARWLARWPNLPSLAAASVEDVLAAWTGLGYYNRARNLHRAAQVVVVEHGGCLPRDAAALAALPGVGPYTQGAVRSIAFAEPAALVDGNVARVLSRWRASHLAPATTAGKRWLWDEAAALLTEPVARARPGDWNQALMELGATCCKARNPGCERCPVRSWCAADRAGLVADLPVRTRRAKPKRITATYLLWQRADGAIWCGRRPPRGRWAGLWEPPGWEGEPSSSDAQARSLLPPSREAIAVTQLATVVHVLTHRRYEVTPLLVRSTPAPPDLAPPDLAQLGYVAQGWVSPEAAAAVDSGLSRLAVRLFAAATAPTTG